MKYDLQAFNAAVAEYAKILSTFKAKNKTFYLLLTADNQEAFLSLAPLSRAIHEAGGDMAVSILGRNNESHLVVFDAYALYSYLQQGVKNDATLALDSWLKEAEKKVKNIRTFFKEPDFILEQTEEFFVQVNGNAEMILPFNNTWFRKYRWKDLRLSADIIWKQLYNAKKGEVFSFSFDLIPKKKDLLLPLEDYLDSYAIVLAMKEGAECYGNVSLGSSTMRMSQRDDANAINELKNTLLGCHLSLHSKEKVFTLFRPLAQILKTERFLIPSAVFGISGRGYYGKHEFGECIGYPTTDGKSRWQSASQILYKLSFYPQAIHDKRRPQSRIGFTSTLPLDVFIKTTKINWLDLKKRDDMLIKIFDRCIKIVVKGNKKVGGYLTDFEVGLVKKDRVHRLAHGSDVDIRSIVDQKFLKKTGIFAGNMANIPGGECFTTPEYLHGTVVGDVVISIDQSYVLSKKEPFVIKADRKKGYHVVSAPKKILATFNQKKKESWQSIIQMEKHMSAPAEMIRMEKERFNKIGEFAINTHPKAELCDYLIVNEKIANMMHVAMGSGFEADTSTTYHTDVVFDAPGQLMDVYGVDAKGNKHWMIRKGRSVLWK